MTDNESLSVRVGTFLFKPEIFFRQLAETLPRYLLPLLIVLVTGIFSAVWTWLHLSWFFSFFSAGLSGTGPGSHQFSFIFDMVVISLSAYFLFDPLITVICAGLVFYILACFVSKSGSLTHTIIATSWGSIPLAVFHALSIPLFLAFRPGMSVTVSPEWFAIMNNSTAPSAVEMEMMEHMVTWNQSFYTCGMISTGLHVLAFLCCAWFWIPAIRNTCAVEQRHAILIVLVPLLLYLTVTIGPNLVTGGYGL